MGVYQIGGRRYVDLHIDGKRKRKAIESGSMGKTVQTSLER